MTHLPPSSSRSGFGSEGPEDLPLGPCDHADELRARLLRYARRLIGDRLVDGHGPEEFVDLAMEKLSSGVRRIGGYAPEQVAFGAVRSLIHHARRRDERCASIDDLGSGESELRAVEHRVLDRRPARADLDPMVLRDALVKVAQYLEADEHVDALAVVRCIIDVGGCGYLPPRQIASCLGWDRTRVYRAWQQVKERFIRLWDSDSDMETRNTGCGR